MLFRERFADGKVPDPMDTLKLAQMMFDINLRMDKVRGLTLIYDYENTGLAFVKAFFPVIRRALMIQSVSKNHINFVIFHNISRSDLELPGTKTALRMCSSDF